MNLKIVSFFVSISLFIGFDCNGQSQEIYRWKDRDGRIVYSSVPRKGSIPADGKDPKNETANLPPIKREKFIPQKANLQSCLGHGGISCPKGADEDGSVICVDGFRDAAARFRFLCNEPRLEVADVSEPGESGTFIVYVRNLAGVPASAPEVVLRSLEGIEVKSKGPTEIAGLSMGEFIFESNLAPGQKAAASNFLVRCGNCRG
jgi:hypothetical protein